MAKRSATSELNHDNWDREDEKEEPGTFKSVDNTELKNRVIRKAKRSLNSDSSANSPFQSSSPFAKFSGFTASSPFSFLKKTDSTTTGRSPLHSDSQKEFKTENGNSVDVQDKKPEDSKDVREPKTTTNTPARENPKPTRSMDYYRQLQSLNESLLKWMQLHLSKNSCCDFTPVFNDYKKHLDTLNVTYPVKKKESSISEEKTNSVFKTPLALKEDTSKVEVNKNTNSNVNSGFKKETPKNDDETDYGANFSARTTNTSTFSFGIKGTSCGTATSSGSPLGPAFSSKEGEKVPEKKPFQFTFGTKSNSDDSSTSKPFSFASAIAAKSEETAKEEENYEPPKPEFVAVSEEDALYSKRCKLFFKKGNEFTDKGVGTLYLKSLEGKTQLLVRADTNLGNVLLNIMLSSSLPMSRTGKNNVLLVCVPNPPLDAKSPDSKEAIPMLIRVKTSEDADELLDALNKHKS